MLPFILQAVSSLGHKVFTDGDYNLNIIGVRNKDPQPDAFDDMICCVFKEEGQWVTYSWPVTTDPGNYYLNNPTNVDGTAILVPGQYRGVYKIDMHRGEYPALCQREGVVNVWRDRNKDSILDYGKNETEGYFGINIHRATSRGASENVGRWSAGCQVFQSASDFALFMELCECQRSLGFETFTYTLIVPNKFLMVA